MYDFSDFGAWQPYVGAGLGVARGRLNARTHRSLVGGVLSNNPQCSGSAVCRIEDSSGEALAWQLLAGLGYSVTENLVWDTQYRYLNSAGMQFAGLGGNSHASVLPGGGGGGVENQC